MSMSSFTPEWDGLPSEDEISEFLAFAGCDLEDEPDPEPRAPRAGAHPYAAPATGPTPSWRGGPPLDHETELAYRREQDDQ